MTIVFVQTKHPLPLSRDRVVSIVWRSVRVCFWFCFNSVMLHFLYFQVKRHASLLTSECSTNFSSHHVHHCVTGERETETERDRERQRHSQRHRQTDRQTETGKHRQRQRDRQTSRERERESYILHVLRLTLNVMFLRHFYRLQTVGYHDLSKRNLSWNLSTPFHLPR